MKWTVTLKGDSWGLKSLAGLGVGVTEEGHAFVLRSPDLDSLKEAGAVPERAIELIEVLNGLARITLAAYDPVEVGPITANDGSDMHYLFTGDTLSLRGREGHELVDAATGQPIARPKAFPDLLKQAAIALQDLNIRRALRFFNSSINPTNLWKVYEVIRDDAGGKGQIVSKQWATEDQIERFRSVHSPSAFGDAARHAVEKQAPPADPSPRDT
jgi:hypothetical protein